MLFHGLGNFGDKYQIKLRPDAKPFALQYMARHVPIPLCEQVKTELELKESIGAIFCLNSRRPRLEIEHSIVKITVIRNNTEPR